MKRGEEWIKKAWKLGLVFRRSSDGKWERHGRPARIIDFAFDPLEGGSWAVMLVAGEYMLGLVYDSARFKKPVT